MDDPIDDDEKRDDGGFDEQNTDIDFLYNDADEYGVEIAELYSYSEEKEFFQNAQDFVTIFPSSGKWIDMDDAARRGHVNKLLDLLESSSKEHRQRAARSMLYLLQGVFKECDLEEDQITWARRNVYLCIECGVLSAALSLLLLEIRYEDWSRNLSTTSSDLTSCGDATCKQPATLTNNANIRVVLSIIYILVETVRDGCQSAGSNASSSTTAIITRPSSSTVLDHTAKLREQFIAELGAPINDGSPLTIVLFGMVHRFCSGLAPHFPMKKTLLLLWKTILLTLGPLSNLFERKNCQRRAVNLPELHEDTHLVVRRIRANSPPANPADSFLNRAVRTNNRHSILGQGRQGPRQGSLAGGRLAVQQQLAQQQLQQQLQQRQMQRRWNPTFNFATSDNVGSGESMREADLPGIATPRPGSPVKNEDAVDTPMPSTVPAPGSQIPHSILSQQLITGILNSFSDVKVLPWRPKVRTSDIENFVNSARHKFVHFRVAQDTTSLYGLPEPIHEAVKVLKKYHYISLGEVQIKQEANFAKYPLLLGKENFPDTPAERLYVAMLPLLPQYMIAVLKVLLASAPTSRTKTEPINILAEITPAEAP
uniref:N1221 domain-containing protein n=1 Tax=Mesocestoides corti TaxID=53468 RepID=A0A5K3FGP0_MESCO